MKLTMPSKMRSKTERKPALDTSAQFNRAKQLAKKTTQLVEESKRAKIRFLLTELSAGLTFCDVAKVSRVAQSKKQGVADALKAYESALRIASDVPLTTDEETQVRENLSELKSRLEELGQLV
jgi:hypothetical protein